MTIAEAAKLLDVKPRTINNYFNKPEGHPLKLHRHKVNGKVVRAYRAEIEAILAARPTPADWAATVSIAEAATRLGVGVRHINNFFADEQLHREMFSDGSVRVARTEVEDLLAKRWCNGQTTIDPRAGAP